MKNQLQRKITRSFHKDGRPTFVLVDNKLYAIMESIQTLDDLKKIPLEKRPHVRYLNEIPERSSDEQKQKNLRDFSDEEIIYKDLNTNSGKEKVTSLKKAIKLGVNVSEEITKLLKEKEEAKKCGDKEKARKIRIQLRKLDYKRNKGE